MAKVKSGVAGGGYGQMNIDVAYEDMELGEHSQAVVKAKQTGSGIGGLLGAIIGIALAPVTGGASIAMLAGAAGGAIGAYAGSKIGEKASGVNVEKDILTGGKFRKASREKITSQISDMETASVWQGAMQGAMGAIGPLGGGVKAFKTGATAAKAAGGSALSGGIGNLSKFLIPGGKAASTYTAAGGAGAGVIETTAAGSSGAGMMMDGQWIGSAAAPPGMSTMAGASTGGGLGSGLLKAAGGAYTGIDKMVGGVLPGGQNLAEGYLAKGAEGLKGLLGGKANGKYDVPSGGFNSIGQSYEDSLTLTNPQSSADVSSSARASLGLDFLAPPLDSSKFSPFQSMIMSNPSFDDSEWVKAFQREFMGMKEGDSGFGTSNQSMITAFQQYNQ